VRVFPRGEGKPSGGARRKLSIHKLSRKRVRGGLGGGEKEGTHHFTSKATPSQREERSYEKEAVKKG